MSSNTTNSKTARTFYNEKNQRDKTRFYRFLLSFFFLVKMTMLMLYCELREDERTIPLGVIAG